MRIGNYSRCDALHVDKIALVCLAAVSFLLSDASAEESWLQFKFDGRNFGNVPDRQVGTPLGLIGSAAFPI